MSHASLASRYRPQSFAEVAGQETITAILSSAALQNKVAPAYLLSGTRGVGKTTIARIFAKALNCERAPVAEPCNECDACKRIVSGSHVDVIEIDGASNGGVEDARRLRETINYAPMDGRYKVYIIDEAHMLSNQSFNALLKTLEEPPAGVTFILATTEAHKFPITIVSRCQHFVFKALSESKLIAHLTHILQSEQIPFEDAAVSLIARRAAGSVRDGISLMGQALAFGGNTLTQETVRNVLGLAGQELYQQLLMAFQEQNCLEVVNLTRTMLEQGVDLGFFVRELTFLWRNLFIIKQAGPKGAESLNLPKDETDRLVELAKGFSLTYIHAAWQMVLDNQRQVLHSLEPATALELLLLNLTLLPQLVSLETLSKVTLASGQGQNSGQNSGQGQGQNQGQGQGQGTASAQNTSQSTANNTSFAETSPPLEPATVGPMASDAITPPVTAFAKPSSTTDFVQHAPIKSAPAAFEHAALPMEGDEGFLPDDSFGAPPALTDEEFASYYQEFQPAMAETTAHATGKTSVMDTDKPNKAPEREDAPILASDSASKGSTWQDFIDFCKNSEQQNSALLQHMQRAMGEVLTSSLEIQTNSVFQYDILTKPSHSRHLELWVKAFNPALSSIQVKEPSHKHETESELKQKLSTNPVLKTLEAHFGTSIVRCFALSPSTS